MQMYAEHVLHRSQEHRCSEGPSSSAALIEPARRPCAAPQLASGGSMGSMHSATSMTDIHALSSGVWWLRWCLMLGHAVTPISHRLQVHLNHVFIHVFKSFLIQVSIIIHQLPIYACINSNNHHRRPCPHPTFSPPPNHCCNSKWRSLLHSSMHNIVYVHVVAMHVDH